MLPFLTGCSASEQDQSPPHDESVVEEAVEEPPMFRIDPNATGPLTMNELQVDLPESVEVRLTPEQHACFFREIETIIADAGDPQELDPANLSYLHPRAQWPYLSAKAKRTILAQVVFSEAMRICL